MNLFDDLDSGVEGLEVSTKKDSKPTFKENCARCGGSGKYRGPSSYGSHCFDCDGKGFRLFSSSPEQRNKAKEKRAAAKASKLLEIGENFKKFCAQNPDIVEWWTNSNFEFAQSLRNSASQYGGLTPNQVAAARKSIEKAKEFRAKKEEELAVKQQTAPSVDVTKIEKVFQIAANKGLKSPKLRLGEFTFAPAKSYSKNAGSIYVTRDRGADYLGKISDGKFLAVRGVEKDLEVEVARVASTPQESAIAYGRLTGNCSICGRELTKGESVSRGIGPICAEKFGW